jgi:hypothetical protein
MTLKEKIEQVSIKKGMCNQLEQIADDYAIDFAEWCLKYVQYYDIVKSIRYYTYLNGNNVYTNLELLEIFKKEKGL